MTVRTAKTDAKFPEFKIPQFKLPEFKTPKFDVDAMFALTKANFAAAYEAQNVLVDAAHAIVKVQHGWAQDIVTVMQSFATMKSPMKPETAMADAKAHAEKAMAVAKEQMDLGVAARICCSSMPMKQNPVASR
jgi:hypothetical protein